MGRESASYYLTLPAELQAPVVAALSANGAERVESAHGRVELRLRDPNRYWIDVRVHGGAGRLLEIRIALTNDEWAIRAPLEAAFAALPPGVGQLPLRDEDGAELGPIGTDGWSLRLEDDYGRRRADFTRRVGEVNAPISADHVYAYLHQTGWRRDDDAELQWKRERELARMEEMWDPPVAEPELPPGHPERGDGSAGEP